jgi:predicted CXXCH cytochrome family protein
MLTRLLIVGLLLIGAASADEYVDSWRCATCHKQIAESFRLTGMGRSIYKPAPANTIENYRNKHEFDHARSETHYSMTIRDGAYYQRRWQTGFDGKETNVEEMKIDYVIGSGNHARSYLHRTATGGLIELPLGWYAEKGGYWAMSPGFDTAHPQTRRFVSYECMFCHNAIPRIPAGHDAPGSDPVFTGNLPEGIDCQRCHGPGARHVRTAETAGAKRDEIRQSILNPARLSPALRMDVCMQCHLEPTSTEFPSLIRRFDHGPFSYRPGERLDSFLLAFDHAPGKGYDDKFEIVNSSAYRLRKSQCFLKSNGAMTCETCHDPHRALRGEAATQRYSAVCRNCHESRMRNQHPAATECISCHMPKRRTEDVVHAVMTDHLIQRRPPSRDFLGELPERHPPQTPPYRGEVIPYYPASLTEVPQGALYKAVAQVAMDNNLREGIAELQRARPTDAEFYMVLARGWEHSGNAQEAIASYREALKLKPDFVRGLISLAGALKSSGQLQAANEALARAVQIAPQSAPAWFQSGTIDFAQGHSDAAIQKMQKAIALDPDLSGAHAGLAQVLWRAGRSDAAEREARQALNMDPYDADTCDLMGRLLFGQSRTAEGLFDFEKAVRLRPGYAPHLYDFGLALSSLKRFDEAQVQVEAALRADPGIAEAHELLGGLFAEKKRLPDAAREYAEAIRLKPDFARAHLDLARVLVAQGETQSAIEELRKAAAGSDPQTAEVAGRALRSLSRP